MAFNESFFSNDDEAKISTQKMITKSKGKGQLPITKAQGISNAPTGSGLWSGLKDPRIVRASRGLGGKDRHSKVSTIRGLRDRRVRLSVSTAIQLYDLQDRLGLNQPSKAVDWLLNAAQHEIDKLPPLQLPPRDFDFRHHEYQASKPAAAAASASNKHQCLNDEGLASSSSNTKVINMEDEALMGNHDVAIYNAPHDHHHHHHLRGMPFASYYHWDPSNRSFLSQFGILSSPPSSHDHSLITNTTPAQPSQLLRCPPPMFSSYMTATFQNEFDGRQFMSHLQMGSAPQKPDHFS